jgi:signal transduction histidine kinase
VRSAAKPRLVLLVLRSSLRTQITTKVVALSAAAALLLGTTLVVLIVAVTGQRDAAQTAFRSQEALSLANQLETSLLSIESGLNRYVTTENPTYLASVNRERAAYPAITRRLVGLFSSDAAQQRRVRAIGEAIGKYDQFWALSLIEIARQDFDVARSQVETDGGRSRIDRIRTQLARLFDHERAVIRAREDSAERLSARAIGLGIGGLVLVIAVALGFTLYLRRSVLRPVRAVAEATGRLAAGDLATRVPDQREDELGELARGFNSMADSLERGRSELERSNAELTRSNAELEQFASVTSHDLQAPLTTISMYTELLERRRGDDGAGTGTGKARTGELDLVEGIRGATQQARGLIRDLLEYSRAGRGQLALERVPAGRIVEQAIDALAGAIEAARAQVSVGELPVVLADRANLCRVFQNLIGNAVKFTTQQTPRVRIEAEREGEHWHFFVRDNGIGMNPEHARRIFEPFQRLHGEEDYPGSGIGLAVCERIIDQHAGRIWVTSAPGEGSVFHFTLPAATPATAEAPRVAVSA